jgi:hypothetical protein
MEDPEVRVVGEWSQVKNQNQKTRVKMIPKDFAKF